MHKLQSIEGARVRARDATDDWDGETRSWRQAGGVSCVGGERKPRQVAKGRGGEEGAR
jgi:hypothetical protein